MAKMGHAVQSPKKCDFRHGSHFENNVKIGKPKKNPSYYLFVFLFKISERFDCKL